MRHAAATFVILLAGCTVGEAQSRVVPVESRCRVDADCVVVRTMPSCGPCGSCAGAARAVSRAFLEREGERCASERRSAAERDRRAMRRGAPIEITPPNCSPCPSPPESSSLPWVAACRERVCEAFVEDAGARATVFSPDRSAPP